RSGSRTSGPRTGRRTRTRSRRPRRTPPRARRRLIPKLSPTTSSADRTAARNARMALVPFPGAAAAHDPEPLDPDESGGKMSFLEHLDELRKRLIYICLSVLGGCLIAFVFIQRVFDFIMKPMRNMLPGGNKLIYTAGAEPF